MHIVKLQERGELINKKRKQNCFRFFVRAKGLEPPRLSALDPKSSAATNYATPALVIGIAKVDIFFTNPNILKKIYPIFCKILHLPNCQSPFLPLLPSPGHLLPAPIMGYPLYKIHLLQQHHPVLALLNMYLNLAAIHSC